jgi:hypothetical protein
VLKLSWVTMIAKVVHLTLLVFFVDGRVLRLSWVATIAEVVPSCFLGRG